MTDTVVTSSDSTTIITTSDSSSIITGDAGQPTIIVTGIMGPKGVDGSAGTVGMLTDVDVTNVQDGSLLIYSSAQNKWLASNTLNSQVLEAGQY